MKRCKRWLKVAGIVAVLVLVAALAFVAYLCLGGLDRHRHTVARIVSDALGRELRVHGGLDLDLGRAVVLEIDGVTLANPEWASEPAMVAVDHLTVGAELAPLLRGAFHVRWLQADGVTVRLERDAEGRASWDFPRKEPAAAEKPEARPLDLEVDDVVLTGVSVAYVDPAVPPVPRLEGTRIDIESDAEQVLTLELAGYLEDHPLTLSGTVATLPGLLSAGAVRHDLVLTLGDGRLRVVGDHGRLGSLRDLAAELELAGEKIEDLTTFFRLPSLGSGPFSAQARLDTTGDRAAVDLEAELGDLEAAVHGFLDSLEQPTRGQGRFSATGASLAAAGALGGLSKLPDEPFEATGEVQWEGFPLELRDIEVRVGEARATLSGSLGALAELAGSDLRFEASVPDLAIFSAVVGVELPARAVQVSGHVIRNDLGFEIDAVTGRLGSHVLAASGTLGMPPELVGTDLELAASGPDLGEIGVLVGADLPELPYEVRGRARPAGRTVQLEGVEARLGRSSVRLAGHVETRPGLVGTEVGLKAHSADLGELRALAPQLDRVAGPASARGRFRVQADGIAIDGVEIDAVGTRAEIDGKVVTAAGLVGSSFTVRVHGSDVSVPAAVGGLDGLPQAPFRLAGTVDIAADTLHLDLHDVALGEIESSLRGRVGLRFAGADIRFEVSGPRLADVGSAAKVAGLPAEPFALGAHVVTTKDGIALFDAATFSVGPLEVDAHGSLDPRQPLQTADVSFEIVAPDTNEIACLASDLVALPELPALPLRVEGRLAADSDGFDVLQLQATVGRGRAELHGRIGALPDLFGTDLTVNIDGLDASVFTIVAGVSVPVAPFEVGGRVERHAGGSRFHELSLRLGDYRARVDGSLGELPRLVGTDLDVWVEGPNLSLVEQLAKTKPLPGHSFEVSGHLSGTPENFAVRGLAMRFGPSDVSGSFQVDIVDRPLVQARLVSKQVDLRGLQQRRIERAGDQEPEPEIEARAAGDRVIPDEVIDLSVLDTVDGDLEWRVGTLQLLEESFSDINLGIRLENGHLEAGPLAIEGSQGGRLSGELRIDPVESGYGAHAAIKVENARLRLAEKADGEQGLTPFNLDIALDAHGGTMRELAATASGRIAAVAGPGMIDRSIADLLVAGIAGQILDTLNPFSKEKQTSTLDCLIVQLKIDNGVGVVEPMTLRTEQMVVLGHGGIDLGSEEINFEWASKPRKGLGLSASTITNSYISLGGTLAAPRLAMKPMEALTTTGVAIATAGISVLGKGLLDRISAEGKVCENALSQLAGAEAKPRKKWWQIWK